MNKLTLYLVATPIGNLNDITPRALEILREADFIAAEDTRHTLKLLNHFDIKKPMISYFEHNKREKGEYIVSRIENGETCALVTDAGTPAISDPGEDIVKLCAEKGIDVVPVPGACAFVQALIISGLPTGRFSFEGFLSVNKPQRKAHLEEIKEHRHTLIFYEAPHKLKTTLKDLLNALGNRKIAVVKELTKIHESVLRTDLEEASKFFEENQPKGEYVLVVEGFVPPVEEINLSDEDIINKVNELIAGGMDKKSAIKEASVILNLPKRQVYELMISNKA